MPNGTGNNAGITFANFLYGTVGTATYTQEFASWLPRWWSHQWYAQTDWKPVRGVTINLGVRWSYESPFNTKYGQQAQFDPTVKDPISGLTGAIVHRKDALASRDMNNFAPRVGLAWNFHPKMVFRGSYGIVHQDIFATGSNIQFQEYLAQATVAQPVGDPRHVFRLSQGPPSFTYTAQPDGSVPFIRDQLQQPLRLVVSTPTCGCPTCKAGLAASSGSSRETSFSTRHIRASPVSA